MPTTAAETMVWCETSKTQTHRKCTAYVGNALYVIFQLEAARNLFPLRPAHVDGPGGWHTSARMLQTREGPKAQSESAGSEGYEGCETGCDREGRLEIWVRLAGKR